MSQDCPGTCPFSLGSQQQLEERAVALKADPELFRRDIVCLAELRLERIASLLERARESLDHLGDERIGLLDRLQRLVHKGALDRLPTAPQLVGVVAEQRDGLLLLLRRILRHRRRSTFCASCASTRPSLRLSTSSTFSTSPSSVSSSTANNAR